MTPIADMSARESDKGFPCDVDTHYRALPHFFASPFIGGVVLAVQTVVSW